MAVQPGNKTIVNNTVILYIRMMFTMLVTLYTSRVVLDVLGVEDYGIYQAVGGVVLVLSFVNNALANGTSRFLTFEIGVGNADTLNRTFSTVLWANVGLALIVVLFAETIGLWFVSNQLIIPLERTKVAIVAYHFSIATCFLQLVLVPYNASIISHENMGVYAYMSIVDVCLKLLICYLLNNNGIDKLILYAGFLFSIQLLITLFCFVYCYKHYSETRKCLKVDKGILRSVTSYSSWSLIASTEGALNNQGATVLINMFFSPSVVSARAIANQVNMAANQFVSNFRTAVNPQIVKKYAIGDFEGSKKLLLESTKYSFYMMLVLSIPICLVAEDLLSIWLKEVPEYTVVFLRLAILTSLFQVFDTSFYTALYAKGQIKENALTAPALGLLIFPISYCLFKIGCSPIALAWAMLVFHAILGLIQKPLLIIHIAKYTWRDVFGVFIPCFRVFLLAIPIPLMCCIYSNVLFPNTWLRFGGLIVVSVLNTCIVVWFWGLTKNVRSLIIGYLRNKMRQV